MAIVGDCLFSLGCCVLASFRSIPRCLFPGFGCAGWKINLSPFDSKCNRMRNGLYVPAETDLSALRMCQKSLNLIAILG